MLRFWGMAGVCFAVMLLAAGSIMLNATPHTLLGAIVPNARELAVAVAAMTFAVAAVIERAP